MLTDFHSHILPEMDDGSASLEESVSMLRMEGEQGITRVVATPHFYPQYDEPERFLDRRAEAEEKLRTALEKEPGLPQILPGAEVYFFRGMCEWERLDRLAIGEKKCILIEMPPPPWTDSIYQELERIWHFRGITPVIAHIDRYISPFRTHDIPRRLAQLPVLVQANASFFLERSTSGMAMRMLKSDQIHLLGSDCHNMSSRKPDLGPAVRRIERKLGDGAVSRIRGYENAVLIP